MGEGEEQAEAGGGERVAERDGAAVDVDLLGVDLERAGARHGDAGERLVDLPQVDVSGLDAVAREQLARRPLPAEGGGMESGPATTARPTTSASGSWPAAVRVSARGQDSGGAAVRELGGVARRDRALARERSR